MSWGSKGRMCCRWSWTGWMFSEFYMRWGLEGEIEMGSPKLIFIFTESGKKYLRLSKYK